MYAIEFAYEQPDIWAVRQHPFVEGYFAFIGGEEFGMIGQHAHGSPVRQPFRQKGGCDRAETEIVGRNQRDVIGARKKACRDIVEEKQPDPRLRNAPVRIGDGRTSFGRRVLATGGGETAARYSGIDTKAIKFRVLVISSTAAAFAGMLYAGRLQSGRFQLGEGDELSVIAAAVLGGTSLFGGKGTIIGTIVGALMIGMINNGLILMGLEFSQQLIARGGIIILAVALSQKRS